MTVFFTGDTHFGHSNIIRYSNRPFESAALMNEALISNWNKAIGPQDSVYHIGDVSILRPERTKEILDRLNGKIYLIRGNHDDSAEHKLCRDRFEWIKDYYFAAFHNEIRIALFHYAMRTWNKKHHGAWHLYGHSHGNLPPIEGEFSLDIGTDCWNYSPISLETLRLKMEERGWKPIQKPSKQQQIREE